MRRVIAILGCCAVLGLAALGYYGLQTKKAEANMTNENLIARVWVEIREDSTDEKLVLRPTDYPIPPARGRRQLELTEIGQGQALEAGPADKLETVSHGGWSIEDQTLLLNIEGWEGTYEIEDLQDDILVLRKR